MVFWQETPPKVECLLLHRYSIFMPSKFAVGVPQIVHAVACHRARKIDLQSTTAELLYPMTQHAIIEKKKEKNSRFHAHTYIRMILRQHALSKLECFLLQNYSMLMATDCAVGGRYVAHRCALSIARESPMKRAHQQFSYLNQDDSRAKLVDKTQAPSRTVLTHLGVVLEPLEYQQDCLSMILSHA